ncbi:hypothetical protein ACTWP6_23620 [Mycobacterium sp. 4D054]|uniref:hypothetical protein n=1 Tax=Mycobacterium sp. 4D054 TaxID=3457440 RepID=UPI003FD042F9
MSQHSKLSAAIAAAATTALTTASPAYADPEVCTVYGPHNTMTCKPLTPTTTAPATSTGSGSSGGGISDWIGDHAPALVVICLVVVGIVVWANVSKGKEQQASAALAQGRQIAQEADTALEARSPEDLQRYAGFGWAVPWQRGTAFGNLVDRDGGIGRVHAAWKEACELARIGHWDQKGKFTPAATVVNVNGYGDGTGDLELSVSTADYTIGASS